MTDSTNGSFIDYAMCGAATAHGNEPSSYRSSHLGDGDHPWGLAPSRIGTALPHTQRFTRRAGLAERGLLRR